jgi:hypothetical protein
MPGRINTKRIETFECDCCSDIYTKTSIEARKQEREGTLEHPIRQEMGVDVYDQSSWEILCNVCYDDVIETCYDCSSHLERGGTNTFYSEDGDSFCEDCYYETYGHCDDCGDECHRDYMVYRESREESYCENCDPGDADDVDLWSFNRTNKIESTIPEAESRRFVGIEIECLVGDSEWWDYHDDYPETFRAVSDGSIERGGEESAVEFVHRAPIQGRRLKRSIVSMCDYLIENDFFTNKSCGLHVHVDAADMGYRDLKWTLLLGKSIQDIIYKMMPISRRDGRWAKRIPMSRESILNICDDYDFVDSWYSAWGVEPSYEKYNHSRYCGMNMHSRIINGSIEFRYHSGTINRNKIINWITICQAIVDTGRLLGMYGEAKYITNIPQEYQYIKILANQISERNLTYGEFCKYLRLPLEVKQYTRKRLTKFYDSNYREDYETMHFYV